MELKKLVKTWLPVNSIIVKSKNIRHAYVKTFTSTIDNVSDDFYFNESVSLRVKFKNT